MIKISVFWFYTIICFIFAYGFFLSSAIGAGKRGHE